MNHMMMRLLLISAIFFLFLTVKGQSSAPVVVDSLTRTPLPNASIFNHRGKFIGTSDANGRISCASPNDFPLTVRYIGFFEKSIPVAGSDTVFMAENILELSEVVVEAKKHIYLHVIAYVREYSSLSTYTDTVFLFREKMVDFMLPKDDGAKFRGWHTPRVLNSKSYYRFTDLSGLDSVSDRCSHHFSWADWVGIAPVAPLPIHLMSADNATDTVRGKYSPTEIWNKSPERVSLDVNVLADTASRRWVPGLAHFFRDDVDFEQLRLRYVYDNVGSDRIEPIDLSGYSFTVESNGRGRDMFLFNRKDQPFFVSTYAETYIIDKEYITAKEAKKWGKLSRGNAEITIFEPDNVPELHPSVQLLVDRVNSLDNDILRLDMTPDKRLAGRKVEKVGIGKQIAKRLLGMFGLDYAIGNKKREKKWKEFREERKKR